MFVIGTAGHVDHGKSTLVHALTGIDPDRLAEEKRRGMTIELGFAWFSLPGGQTVSIIDVPGHERLVRTMLAGAGGIDLALLVIAADSGVMPQTREHLAILGLLGIGNGVVALNRADLVDDEWLALATAEVEAELADSPLHGAPIIPVSALTGFGLPDLVTALQAAVTGTTPRPDLGQPRLPIDRAFSLPGFGTVITGTLSGGSLAVGQEIAIEPGALTGRIRGLQTHNAAVERAGPGSRVAVNLAGLAVDDVPHGAVLSVPCVLSTTSAVDVRLTALSANGGSLEHNAALTLHSGTADVPARLRLLEPGDLEPGQTVFAQLALERPIVLLADDRFVLRRNGATLGGGRVLETAPRRHRRGDPQLLARLRSRLEGDPAHRVVDALAAGQPLPRTSLERSLGAGTASVVERLLADGRILSLAGGLLVTAAWLDHARQRALDRVAAEHAAWPLRPGITREELRSSLGLAGRPGEALVDVLLAERTFAADGPWLRLSDRAAALSPSQRAAADDWIAGLAAAGISPRPPPRFDQEVVAWLQRRGEIIEAAPDIVYARATWDDIDRRIRHHFATHGELTVAEVRDVLGTSRRYALAIMETLDKRHITRRVGDVRLLRSDAPPAATTEP